MLRPKTPRAKNVVLGTSAVPHGAGGCYITRMRENPQPANQVPLPTTILMIVVLALTIPTLVSPAAMSQWFSLGLGLFLASTAFDIARGVPAAYSAYAFRRRIWLSAILLAGSVVLLYVGIQGIVDGMP